MAGLDTIRYIIEALRTKPGNEDMYYVNKPEGRLLKPKHPGGVGLGPMKALQDDIAYTKYRKMSTDMGEAPLSYEEWMGSQ